MQKNKFNVIDLFSGCGGLSLGFEQAGFNVLLGVDVDVAALDTFKHNHKKSEVLLKDLRTIKFQDIKEKIGNKKIDVIVGGPPCQGMSIAGPRKFHDSRNKLYLSFIDLVKEIRPEVFVIENVPGLMSLFKGAIKDSIIEEFTKIDYTVKYKLLNSANFGVPQTRERVFFVGFKDGTNFKFPKARLQEADWITTKDAISDLPLLEDCLGFDEMEYIIDPVNEFQNYCRANSTTIYNHIGTNHTDKTKHIISLVPEGGNYKDLPKKYQGTRRFNVAWTRYHSQRPALTIDTGHRHHFHYKMNRVPTVRENARFQSFPDDFIFFGNKTEQYRQVGNAVPPLLAKAIAEQVYSYIKL